MSSLPLRALAPLIVFVSLLTTALVAETVSIPFVAKAGDAYTVSIEKERVTTNNGAVENHVRFRMAYDAKIEAVAEDGALTLVWTLADYNAEEVVPAVSPVLLDVTGLMGGVDIPIVIAADATGVPLAIVNRGDVEAKMLAKLDAQGTTGALGEVAKRLQQGLLAAPDAAFAPTVMPEAALLSQAQGVALTRGETMEQETQEPSPVGGAAVTYRMRTRIGAESDATLTIETVGSLDGDSVKASALPLFQKLAEEKGVSIEEIANSMTVTRDDTSAYVVSKATGWTESVTVRRHSTSNIAGQLLDRVETVSVTVKRK